MTDHLNIYIKNIRQHKLLTAEEEKTATPEQLILANQLLVLREAKRFAARKVLNKESAIMDYIQSGNVGLIEAANRFKPGIVRFSTYAMHYIRMEIRNTILLDLRVVHVPLDKAKIIPKATKMRADGVPVSQIASELGIKQDSAKALLDYGVTTQEPFGNHDREMVHLEAKALRVLLEKEWEIMQLRLQGYEFDEIANSFGCHPVTARKISAEAIKKLQSPG